MSCHTNMSQMDADERLVEEIISDWMADEFKYGEAGTCLTDAEYDAIEAAEKSGCDLIFMASHGRRGISGFLLGSETNKVLTHSKVPVLVYR